MAPSRRAAAARAGGRGGRTGVRATPERGSGAPSTQRRRGAQHASAHAGDSDRRAAAHALSAADARPKCARTSGATSRIAHCAGSLARGSSTPLSTSAPSESQACSEPWLPPPTCAWRAPVEELVAGGGRQQHLAGGGAGERRPHARERVGVGGREQAPVARWPRRAPRARPRRSTRRRARSRTRRRPGAKRSSPRRGLAIDAPRAARRARRARATSRGRRPRSRARAATTEARIASRSASSQRVDHRGALGGADGDPRLPRCAAPSRSRPRRPSTPSSASSSCSAIVSLTGACEWSAITITACSARNSSTPPGGVHHARELQVGLGDRVRPARRGRACASTSRCRAATAAGSRTGRARPCTRDTQPEWRSRTPGMPRPERQPVRREAKMSA